MFRCPDYEPCTLFTHAIAEPTSTGTDISPRLWRRDRTNDTVLRRSALARMELVTGKELRLLARWAVKHGKSAESSKDREMALSLRRTYIRKIPG
jgi:hypothetical protein